MNIVIVGDGKVGFTLAEYLARESHDVTIVDRDAAALPAACPRDGRRTRPGDRLPVT